MVQLRSMNKKHRIKIQNGSVLEINWVNKKFNIFLKLFERNQQLQDCLRPSPDTANTLLLQGLTSIAPLITEEP